MELAIASRPGKSSGIDSGTPPVRSVTTPCGPSSEASWRRIASIAWKTVCKAGGKGSGHPDHLIYLVRPNGRHLRGWRPFVVCRAGLRAPLSDRADLGCGKLRVNQESERIRDLVLFHQPDQHLLPELGQLAAVGLADQSAIVEYQREGQVTLTGKGGSGGYERARPSPPPQGEGNPPFFRAPRGKNPPLRLPLSPAPVGEPLSE